MADANAPLGAHPPLPAAEPKKPGRYAALGRWAAILIGLVAVLRLAVMFWPSTAVAQCDDSALQGAMKTAIEAKSALKVTGVTNIKTISRADRTAMCSMHVTASDGSQAQMRYRLDLAKDGTQFQIVEAK